MLLPVTIAAPYTPPPPPLHTADVGLTLGHALPALSQRLYVLMHEICSIWWSLSWSSIFHIHVTPCHQLLVAKKGPFSLHRACFPRHAAENTSTQADDITGMLREYAVSLGIKGSICHLVEWQIHPFISKGTMCGPYKVILVWAVLTMR